MQKQNTLAASFSLQGKGLHTGLDIQVTFNPAPENHGYKIKRVDLPEQPIIDAVAENVINTQRGTVIGKKDVVIGTIEHAMAALYASGVDNCLIEVNAPEFPVRKQSIREHWSRSGIAKNHSLHNSLSDLQMVKIRLTQQRMSPVFSAEIRLSPLRYGHRDSIGTSGQAFSTRPSQDMPSSNPDEKAHSPAPL